MSSDALPAPAPVTLREVALAAGVSVATASKALNGQGRMTAETRERIRETAQRLGFRPNSLAQSLLRKRSFTVGLLTNDTYGRFSLPLMAGVSDALVDAGVSVFLCNVEDDSRLGQLHVEAMLDKRVDGIIATGKRIDRHLPIDLSNLRIPVIYAFTQPDPGSVAFVSDDAGGARLAVEHFCGLGRRRIAHVSGPASFAVVRERGIGVPEDVGVIGFDNWEIVAEATRPPLTSVDMNLATLGREAGLALLSLVGGQAAAPGIRKLPCRLVVRQSCGRPVGG
ncbi:MAG: LacI family transcriptional regulator [Mesorhizobium sp.]|nr:MAG: LacI family transcriptional regulator [Mesorhizobium sp.]